MYFSIFLLCFAARATAHPRGRTKISTPVTSEVTELETTTVKVYVPQTSIVSEAFASLPVPGMMTVTITVPVPAGVAAGLAPSPGLAPLDASLSAAPPPSIILAPGGSTLPIPAASASGAPLAVAPSPAAASATTSTSAPVPPKPPAPRTPQEYAERNFMWLRCVTKYSLTFEAGGNWVADEGKAWLKQLTKAKNFKCWAPLPVNWDAHFMNGQDWGDVSIEFDFFGPFCDQVDAVKDAVKVARKVGDKEGRELYIYNCPGFNDYPWSFQEWRDGREKE